MIGWTVREPGIAMVGGTIPASPVRGPSDSGGPLHEPNRACHSLPPPRDVPGSISRGMFYGFLFASPLWLTVGLVLWMVR